MSGTPYRPTVVESALDPPITSGDFTTADRFPLPVRIVVRIVNWTPVVSFGDD